ncbi:sulfotransferase ssu-1 [Dermacentor silvarum]|uniref:sulfotransferase ssu-1 n=1 Tax=Dermacentor silvarum TaxID=543639 RepID=UPI001898BDDA|nr:sulfotransferase ssu-1 [Dermacentor silvarum]
MYNILMDAEQSTNPFDLLIRFPCLELQGAEAAVHAPKPSVFRSHLPFNKIPYSPEAKYVYIARNPYDSCVSFYYHTRDIPFYRFRNGTFDQFFELFMQGRVEHGEYFENVISWYEHRNDSNVLFLTYEELKKDTRDNVLKIAAFMGPEREEKLRKDPELINRVLENTSLEHMKRLLNYDAQKPP